ncbi:hypothetical protein [Streptomyces sp. NBC_00503]|uniref:hypothetical protein n=1 Tax=Streptomyces sp. NBC_00503 TaxID=2903659 RepID=UPI002E803378|nr:hypothetical protein [Streptomyces sp. NBC_00503]WUD80242.1 hypothetical protein OG490_06550 [Streptomyces sp. NBC_00503]
MASFTTHRLRVHDTSRTPQQRFAALRTCITEFAPYGFHATYHHLYRSAGIPVDLEEDPQALVRAVEELHAAREVWLAEFLPWQERRKLQKAAGVRQPDPPEPLRMLYCPDPESHPTEPLPTVMPRIMGAARRNLQGCPVCERDGGTKEWRVPHGVYRGLCAECGVQLEYRWEPDALVDAPKSRWKLIWRRRA